MIFEPFLIRWRYPTMAKSNDWCRVNDTVNEVSMKPDDNKKSLRAIIDGIAICSEKVSSFENEEWNRNAANGG
jgi:hypothetical protein